ncbi:hypothetical protein [Streptosporangium sandarakinum]
MADRTVTTRLRLAVTDFVAGATTAKRSMKDLNRQFTETAGFAAGFRKKLEDATKALPKIEIDANSSPAEVKIAEIRARLDTLSRKEVGVDIDAGQAYAELQALQREMEALDSSDVAFEVRASVGQALAELRAIDLEISRVDGRNAQVDVNADVGGALASIGMVGAALASLPAVTTIAVGVTALGGAFAAAGLGAAAFSAVAVPSLGRINDALKAQETAAKAASGATGGAGQSAAQAAQQAMQLEQAEKRLADAQKDERQAQEDLTRAREAGRRALEDMNFSLERSILSQKDAALAVREAEARLQEVMADPESSDLDIERAMLSVEQAHQRAREQEVKTQRAKKDTAAANKAGVNGTKEYQQGLENLQQAQEKVAQAEQQLKMLHLQQQAAMSGGGGAASKLKDAFADLSKEERVLAKDIKKFKDEYEAWQKSLQPDVFPVIAQGLDLMRLGLKEAGPMAKAASGAFLTLGRDAEAALRGPFWQDFLDDVTAEIPGAITSLGHIGMDVFTGLAGVIQAFLPYTQDALDSIEKMTSAWSDWGTNLQNNTQFHEFLLWVQQNGPAAVEVVKNLAEAGGNLAEGLAPVAGLSFSTIGVLAKILAGMDPDHITAIALAIIAIKTAQGGLKIASFFTELPGKVDVAKGKVADFGDSVSKAKGKASGFVSSIGEMTSGLGGLAGIVGGVALTVGLAVLEQRLADNAAAAERFVEKATALGGGNIDQQIAAVTRAIEEQRKQIGFAVFDTIYFSDAEREAADNVEALEDKLVQLKHQKELDAIASKVAGDAAGEHGKKVDSLNRSLDTFAGKTNAYQAIRNMETAYKDAKSAIEAANGKLEINSRMTDAQKDAVIRAREAFGGYIEKAAAGADAQAKLSGRTGDATIAIYEQLPKLFELAGKSAEARDRVYELAQKFGINREEADKARTSTKLFREELEKLKDKKITLTLDLVTSGAAKRLDGQKMSVQYGGRALADGGIRNADGREYMASGGIRNLGSNPPAMIAKSPYMISGRSGPDVVFGEAGLEAFIPLSSGRKDRGLQVLEQAAGIMGMAVVPAKASINTGGGSTTGGGGTPPGSASVTLTGIDALKSSIDTTALNLTSSLAGARSTLDVTLGGAGSLTGAVDGVGSAAGELAQQVSGWGEVISVQVPRLTDAVSALGSAMSAAAGGSKGDERNPRAGSSAKAAVKSEPKVMIQGASSITSRPGVAIGGGTNWSTTSRPVQSSSSSWTSGGASSASSGGSSSPAASSPATSGALVQVQSMQVREQADIDMVAERLHFKMTSRG